MIDDLNGESRNGESRNGESTVADEGAGVESAPMSLTAADLGLDLPEDPEAARQVLL